jgi:hypothetical protein
MIEILLVGGSIGFLAAIIGTLVVFRIQFRSLVRLHQQQDAWERTQESHQHFRYLELREQVQQLQQAWQTWEATTTQRVEALAQQLEVVMMQWNPEHEAAQLPRVDEIPLPPGPGTPRQHIFDNWRPARFFRANLSHYDFSHRYLGYANLREAQLIGTNFYMADLFKANLAGANLAGADFSSANLSGADLHNATLTNANLLVADLHQAVLIGANLLGVRNLTRQQLSSAIYDDTTQLDAGFAVSPGQGHQAFSER